MMQAPYRMAKRIDAAKHVRLGEPGYRCGFTIVELLVVTAIIIMLVSLLIVAVNAATRTSQQTRTTAIMDSMKKGLIRFKEDVGYYPPVLGVASAQGLTPACTLNLNDPKELRKLCPNSVPSPYWDNMGPMYAAQMQEYFSTCTLADYLIGYGPGEEDGYGYQGPAFPGRNESPPIGIRDPGSDGVWGASMASGSLVDRKLTNPAMTGKVLGPYLELKDERLLAGVMYVNGELRTFFRGDTIPNGLTFDELPKAIVDYWGMPIRYYRRPYPTGALNQSYRAGIQSASGTLLAVPTLSDVYVLRPQNIKPGTDSTNAFFDQGDPPTNVSTRDLDAAEFALLSFGPDKRLRQNITMHEDNADNIVEVGP